jgi:hypothetical protein
VKVKFRLQGVTSPSMLLGFNILPAGFAVGSVELVDIAASCVIHAPVALRLAPPEELSARETGHCSVVEMLACSISTDATRGTRC